MRAGVLGLLLAVLAFAPAAYAEPSLSTPSSKLAGALKCPDGFAAGREPVLLVHGTGLDAEESWSWNYAKALPRLGYSVCTVTLPDKALDDIQVSTEYVVYALRRIAARSGRRVDVVTHSQGGMEGRWAVKWWPSARAAVDDLVLLASPNHGISTADGACASGSCWPAVWQMRTDAAFIGALNRGDETPGTVSYTNVYSQTDELVQPFSTVAMDGASNVAVQDVCPGRPIQHGPLLSDATTWALVEDAFRHAGPADPARTGTASCATPFMPHVSPVDAIAGNTMLYTDAAAAFAAHEGSPSEPPLKPYAR